MESRITLRTLEDLAECAYDELDELTEELYDSVKFHVNELVRMGYLRCAYNDDEVFYTCAEHVSKTMCFTLTNDIQKKIMQVFVSNKKGTFVLFNTQKGKASIIAKMIRDVKENTELKPVCYIVVSNDKTLADQSADSIQALVKTNNCKMFTLSSSSTVSFDSVQTYIDAYASDDLDEYKMPVIVLLANDAQTSRMIKLMHRVHLKHRRNANLKNFAFFDEADETYPRVRDQVHNGISFMDLIDEELSSIWGIVWLSATDGELLDNYPECANAANYIPDEEEIHCPNYRAIHHPESIIRIVKSHLKESKNGYAVNVLQRNMEHFMADITLKNGSIGKRNIIVNSNTKSSEMREFARLVSSWGFNALVFNMHGVSMYLPNTSHAKRYNTRNKRFNVLLHEIYMANNLRERPTIILGNRKVNRGMTFHYAPPDGSDGLIWTDIILGRIDDESIAVQKAGRGAGKIAHCPQYPGNIHYWTTDETASIVLTHNRRVEHVNTITEECTIRKAMEIASGTVPRQRPGITNIPVKIVFNNADVRESVIDIQDQSYARNKQARIHEIIIKGIQDGHITLFDNNTQKFDITQRTLKSIRMYKNGHQANARRFRTFSNAHEKNKNAAQEGTSSEYNIDMAKDEYVDEDGFVNPPEVAWITFRIPE